MIYQTILSGTAVSNPPKVKTPLGTPSGLSVKIINQTPYELDIYRNEDQIDALPPFAWVILPNLSGLSVMLNTGIASTVLQPYNYVAFTTIDQAVPYQTGSTYQTENASYGLYQTKVYDSTLLNYGSFTLAAKQTGNYLDYSKLTFNVDGAKRIRIFITFSNMTGLSGSNNIGFQHDYWESSDGTDYYYNSDVYDYTTSNGTGYALTDSGAKPTLESGFKYLQLRPFFYNQSSASVTVSGGTRIVLEADY